jgi:hypothetical protein
MLKDKVFLHPLDKMILECPLDNLVKDIRGHHLVDVSAREVVGERLQEPISPL